MGIVTSVSEFVTTNSGDLAKKGLARSRTASYCNVQTGIKNKSTTFSIESTSMVIQAAGIDPVSSGDTTIGGITVTVDPLLVRENVSQTTLENYFESWKFKAGQKQDDTSLGAFVGQYVGEKVDSVSNWVDKLLWQGNKASGSGNYARTDGFLKVLADVTGSTELVAATAITESNAIAIVKEYYDNLPAAAKDLETATMFVGSDEFILIAAALATANLYHFDPKAYEAITELDFYYRPLKIVKTPGLAGTGQKVVCADPSKLMMVASDVADEMAEGGVKFWFSDDKRTHIYEHAWAQGVGIAIPAFFVQDYL